MKHIAHRREEPGTGDKSEYYRHTHRQIAYCLCFIALSVFLVFFLFGISSNAYFSWTEGWGVLWDHINGVEVDKWRESLFWDHLFPRSICAFLVGGVLGMAGAVMQIIMRNPLADPYTVGISSGAGLGATLYIALGVSIIPGLTGDPAQILNSFILSLVPATIIVIIMMFRRTSPGEMILIGLGLMYFFTAAQTMLLLSSETYNYQQTYQWTLGNLSSGWGDLGIIAAVAIVGFALLMTLSGRISILNGSDSLAASLGENPHRVRIVSLFITSLVVAGVVCFTGTIGFVGLIAPHVVRLTMGYHSRLFIPASFCVGSVILLLADCVARPLMLSAGVITALIGGPLFLYILIKMRRKETMA